MKNTEALSVINKYLKGLITQKTSDGFTLIELLVAASISIIVVGLAGFGVVAITENNKKAKAETERRVELNRALDFIAEEVRQAKSIATSASANLSRVAPGFDSSGKTPVITLEIPGVSQRVIYYIASSISPWLGPQVIYRWGPNFGNNGQYTNPNNVSVTGNNNPANWQGEPLVDLIVDTTPSPTPSCLTNWSLNPSSGSTGFYACVDPNGRIADIHLRGKLTDAYGNFQDTFEVSTKVFARPYNPTFTTSSGTVTITQPSTIYIEALNASINCSVGGAVFPTTTTIYVTPSGGSTTSTTVPSSTKALNLSATIGTTITVKGTAPGLICGGLSGSSYYSNTDNGTQVLTLRNGDSPSLFNPFVSHPPIGSFLTKYLNPATGKVTLAENQVIFLFELDTTNTTSPTYDMQDLVVLATILPS